MIKIARSIGRSFVCALRIYVEYQASLISNVQCVKHLSRPVSRKHKFRKRKFIIKVVTSVQISLQVTIKYTELFITSLPVPVPVLESLPSSPSSPISNPRHPYRTPPCHNPRAADGTYRGTPRTWHP